MFEQELLEQKTVYKSKLKDEGHANQNNKLSGAKLPKLPITKFNGKYEALPFWGNSAWKLTRQVCQHSQSSCM